MYRLWHSPICPYAQRPLALLTRLEIPHESVEVDLDDRPAEFLERTPTGKVPLLEEGGFRLYESLHVIEHLADAHGWDAGHAADPRTRARERLAMWRWDEVVVAAWYPSLREGSLSGDSADAVDAEVDEINRTVADGGTPTDSLTGVALATHWVRMRILEDRSPLPGRIGTRHPGLGAWLDRAAAMEPIVETLPEEATLRQAYLERYVGAGAAA